MAARLSKDPHWICQEKECGQINQFSREACIACGVKPKEKVDYMKEMQSIAGQNKWVRNKGSMFY